MIIKKRVEGNDLIYYDAATGQELERIPVMDNNIQDLVVEIAAGNDVVTTTENDT